MEVWGNHVISKLAGLKPSYPANYVYWSLKQNKHLIYIEYSTDFFTFRGTYFIKSYYEERAFESHQGDYQLGRAGSGKADLPEVGEVREGRKNPDFTATAYRASLTSRVVRDGRRKMTQRAQPTRKMEVPKWGRGEGYAETSSAAAREAAYAPARRGGGVKGHNAAAGRAGGGGGGREPSAPCARVEKRR